MAEPTVRTADRRRRFFCTYFDSGYLSKGLALHASLARHASDFVLYVLCFDQTTWDALTSLGNTSLQPIHIADLEAADPAYLATRDTRNTLEYYWTSTPVFPLYLLAKHPEIDVIMYLDADLGFFGDPEQVFDEMGSGSIYITPHRYSPERRSDAAVSGIYNVGATGFRNDAAGRACLQWWRERCLEWCYCRPDAGRFGDQKYLDDWPSRFPNVVVSTNVGCNLAPWNIRNYRITGEPGEVRVDGRPLVFYHFHGLRQLRLGFYELTNPHYCLTDDARRLIYAPYLDDLERMMQLFPDHRPAHRTGASAVNPRTVLRTLWEGRLYRR